MDISLWYMSPLGTTDTATVGPASPDPERLRNDTIYCGLSILVASRSVGWYLGDNS
jgi:hypothetical protein